MYVCMCVRMCVIVSVCAFACVYLCARECACVSTNAHACAARRQRDTVLHIATLQMAVVSACDSESE